MLSAAGGSIATWDLSSGRLVQTDAWNMLESPWTGRKTMVADTALNFIYVSTYLLIKLGPRHDLDSRIDTSFSSGVTLLATV